jgi:surface-anchored protein
MKYAKIKLTPWLLLGLLLALSCYDMARATTTISSGHTDMFEVEYEQVGTFKPTLHLGVHTDARHFEPADVLLEVESAALAGTAAFSASIQLLLGSDAWILPADLELAENLGIIQAGVAKAGFPDSGAVTFTMVGAGQANPGNFALFTAGSSIRLSVNGATLETSSFSITGSHIHYNWGFSAPGTYTFDMKASYTDALFGALESAVETYTFNVIPEPTCGTLLLIGLVGWVATRKRVLSKS